MQLSLVEIANRDWRDTNLLVPYFGLFLLAYGIDTLRDLTLRR